MEQHIVDLAIRGDWVLLAAVLIGIVVRLLKADSKLIPVVVPAKWRPWVAIGLGILSGVLQAVATGTPWRSALVGGLVSGIAPIVGHELIVESLRGGKEVPVKLPPATLMVLVVAALAGPAMGCSLSFEEARLAGIHARPLAASSAAPGRDDERCRSISTSQRWWKATSTAGLMTAGASGVALIPVPPEFRAVPIGICVGAGVTAAFAKVMADGLAEEWARECSS